MTVSRYCFFRFYIFFSLEETKNRKEENLERIIARFVMWRLEYFMGEIRS